jgi:myo-inositol-1(or 4)-monophosphatase
MVSVVHEVQQLCSELRQVVSPLMGQRSARAHTGVAVGGDVTFDIDHQAEAFLASYLNERQPTWAYYSEDRGLQGAQDPEMILIVDPIDGTRPAAAGFEAACVSVAAVRPTERPTLGDVFVGVIEEIKTGNSFTAERGAGVVMSRLDGTPISLAPSDCVDLERLFWSVGFRGRPARVLVGVVGELIDTSSVGGAVFDLGSAAYCLTRVLTGQLDAYVDVGPAIIRTRPETEVEFRRVGHGAVLNNSPYDLAASYLLLKEAGLPFSDAAGASLEERPVLGSGVEYQLDCIASGNDELQAILVRTLYPRLAGCS